MAEEARVKHTKNTEIRYFYIIISVWYSRVDTYRVVTYANLFGCL